MLSVPTLTDRDAIFAQLDTIEVMTTNINTFNELPVRNYFQDIIDAVDTNQVTIVTAETGAGKSTQIPQYLAEHGYKRVVVTQPRILAARNLAQRVREEWSLRNTEDASEVVGYRTAHERDDSGDTQILYCTDGLQLVREITGSGITEKQVLVLDEVHEWNENMEVLVAWAKKRCQEEPRFKVVVMSATIETESLARFFSTEAIIDIPGRHFEVTKRRGKDLLAEIFAQIEHRGKNVLTFLPGKSEIQNVMEAIDKKATAAGVAVIPLHSQLEAEDQQKAFANYPKGKIILATNIAQTSVTIDDIDVVIDSGLERQSEVRSGVEGLFIAQISQADSLQRAGRAGRTRPGEYILAQYDTMPCLDFRDRPAYAIPEIMRKHIDRLTLRLANVGIDIETLEFYHDPSKRAIQRAKKTLVALGALTANGEVTNIGRQMEQFPVESNYGRMLVEAKQFSKEVQAKLAAIIAIQEIGGIVKGGTRFTGWRKYTKQYKSDLLAQYDVYLALPNISELQYEELGIISKNVEKAEEVIERLNRDLALHEIPLEPIQVTEEGQLIRSITAGEIDQLWSAVDDKGTVEHIFSGQQRELSSSTVVKNPTLISGTPFDLQVPLRSGGLETLHLVTGVTVVNTDLLLEISPHLFVSKRGRTLYDPRIGCIVDRQQVRFGKRVLEGASVPRLEDTDENRKLFAREFSRWAYDQLEKQHRELERFHKRVPMVTPERVQQELRARADGIVALDQLASSDKIKVIGLSKLETYFGDDFIYGLGKPRRQTRPEERRKGWAPKHKRKTIRNNDRSKW
jgi:late competence protein required for DNA uptake (superfamily II DNA/RNA helicase)